MEGVGRLRAATQGCFEEKEAQDNYPSPSLPPCSLLPADMMGIRTCSTPSACPMVLPFPTTQGSSHRPE